MIDNIKLNEKYPDESDFKFNNSSELPQIISEYLELADINYRQLSHRLEVSIDTIERWAKGRYTTPIAPLTGYNLEGLTGLTILPKFVLIDLVTEEIYSGNVIELAYQLKELPNKLNSLLGKPERALNQYHIIIYNTGIPEFYNDAFDAYIVLDE